MASRDDPFGPTDKTVIRVGPAGHAIDPGSPVRRVTLSKPRDPANRTVFDPSALRPDASALPERTVIYQSEPFQDASEALPQAEGPVLPPSQKDWLPKQSTSYPAPNPLLCAAAPILILLGQLRTKSMQPEPVALAARFVALVEDFDAAMASSAIDEADARIARFVLCEAIDDIVSNIPGLAGDAWLGYSLVRRLFRSEFTGTGTFQALNKVLSEPETHLDLVEMVSACLALGLEGQYRQAKPGDGSFETVRKDVYETLRYFRARPEPDLSPRWTSRSVAPDASRMRLPVWAIAAAACALVVAVFFGLRTLITNDADALAARLLALDPASPVTIARAEIAPIVEEKPEALAPVENTAQIDRIRAALQDDIKSGALSVYTRGDFIVVEVSNVILFQPGRAVAKPEFEPVAMRIAASLQPEPGPLKIVGHTDNVRPKKTNAYKSNYDLSLARAEAVEKIIAEKLSDASRIAVEGKGEDEPIADNSTPDGRARNRRVDLLIRREQTL